MSESRREFLARAAAGVVGVAAASRTAAEAQVAPPAPQVTPVAGTPPAFGTAPPVGPEVSAATFAEAERLVRVEMTPAERRPRATGGSRWLRRWSAAPDRERWPSSPRSRRRRDGIR